MRNLFAIKNKGFTLVELLIGVAVLGILMAAIFGILSSSLKAFSYNFSQTKNVEQARKGISILAEELRYATAIDSAVTGTLQVVGPPVVYTEKVFSSGWNTLKYKANINGTMVTRVVSMNFTPGNSDYQTIIIQNQTSPTPTTTYRVGLGSATRLSFQRTDMDATPSSAVKITVTLTMQENLNEKATKVATDIISPNLKPADIVPIP